MAGRGLFLTLVVITLVMSMWKNKIRGVVFTVVQFFWFTAICLYIASTIRFPDRFALVSFLVLSSSLIFGNTLLGSNDLDSETVEDSKNWRPAVVLVVVLALLSLLIPYKYSPKDIATWNKFKAKELENQIADLSRIDNDGIFVSAADFLTAEGMDPWKDKTVMGKIKLYQGGWPTLSPHQIARMRSMNLDGNLLLKLVDQDNKYLITSDSFLAVIKVLYQQRLTITVEFSQVGQVGNLFAYRVTRDSTPHLDWLKRNEFDLSKQ
jgi:hypothetical protein